MDMKLVMSVIFQVFTFKYLRDQYIAHYIDNSHEALTSLV